MPCRADARLPATELLPRTTPNTVDSFIDEVSRQGQSREKPRDLGAPGVTWNHLTVVGVAPDQGNP